MRDNIIHLTGRMAALATVATMALSTAPAAHAQRGGGGAEVNGRG